MSNTNIGWWSGLLARSISSAKVPTALVLLFFASLPALIEEYSRVQQASDFATSGLDYLLNFAQEFDYVIIGAGSAGAVVANRLSANGKFSVLVLQDGGDPNPYTTVPSLYGRVNQPSTDYAYQIVKQSGACLANDQQNCVFTRGKGLGGTSNLNAMNYVRGNPNDYDQWAVEAADQAWSYQNVLEVFKKSEDYYGYYTPLNTTYHSRGGELYVGEQDPSEALNYLFQAFQVKNFHDYDMNAEQQQGYGHMDQTVKAGRRWSTYKAFIEPILNRKNLDIYRYSRALKIHFNAALRATRVTYIRHGIKRVARARKEILLCAGSIDSPRLLMLSGIGPKAQLESVGIPVLADLPVGQNLEDHIGVHLAVTINKSMAFVPERDLTYGDVTNYLKCPLGKLFYTSLGIAYLTSSETNNLKWPDLELLFNGGASEMPTGSGNYTDMLHCLVWLMRPKSRGDIKLVSNDPSVRPAIDPKYFTDPSDITRIVEGIKFIVELFETNALKPLGADLAPNQAIPGCESIPFKTNEYWECFARQTSQTLCHPTGTCRMGSGINDPKAVVDSKLRVLKTKGLRVIDSSIMPNIPTGHTNAATIMIGEMGSAFVLQDSSN